MFIVFGTPRSGTTLVASSLSLHDDILVPDETDFILPAAFILDRVKVAAKGRRLIAELIISTERFSQSLGQYLTAGEAVEAVESADYALAPILEGIYSRLGAKAGRTIVGDKSPNDLVYARMLMKQGLVGSSIKVVHLVRDIRDVLLSLAEAQPREFAELTLYFARQWAQSNLLLQDIYARRPEQYFFLRYEDLVADPAACFARLTRFLGADFQERMLDGSKRAVRLQNVVGHRNLGQPIRQRRGDWRDTMPPEIQARCLVQAREALERFGYPVL
jgi:hypothetical protein